MIYIAFWNKNKSDFQKLARNFKFIKLNYFANLYLEILNNNLFWNFVTKSDLYVKQCIN